MNPILCHCGEAMSRAMLVINRVSMGSPWEYLVPVVKVLKTLMAATR